MSEGQSYYLVASDPDGLNNIFQAIAVETGGSSIKLGENTTVNDTVTPYFSVPENATDVKVQTAAYQGDGNFADPVDATGVTATIDGDKLTVNGFDYSANWVGYRTESDGVTKTPRGQKLIITFTVPVKPLYLGGSKTVTNGEDSGLYESSTATDPVRRYDVPDVNVPLKAVEPTMEDQHIYLTQDADVLSNLISATTEFNVGDQKATFAQLFDGVNNANTDVSFTLKDSDGNVIGTYTVEHGKTTGSWSWGENPPALTGDQYTLSSCVQDIADASNKKEVAVAMSIFVYKPEMTFHDQSKFYGEEIIFPEPTDIVWKSGDKVADTAKMGAAPALTITQDRGSNTKAVGGKEYVVVKQDFPVSTKIEIGGQDMTDFLFSAGKIKRACDTDASHDTATKAETFVVHVQTTSMTVTKKVDGLFANMSRDFGFEVTFSHPAIELDPMTFSLKHNGSKEITGLPVGAEVTVKETPVPDKYTVSYSWEVDKTEVSTADTYTMTKDHVDVTVQNVLDSIPITGVLAGTGPALLIGLIAVLGFAAFFTTRAKKHRRYDRG